MTQPGGSMKKLSLLLLILLACNKSDDPKTASYWIARLDNSLQRPEALRTLGKMGDKEAIPHLVTWLKQEGPWQPDAAYALGGLGDKSVVPDLLSALDYAATDTHARVKVRTNVNVARALAMLKATEATDKVLLLLQSPSPTVREAAILALGDLNDKRATDPLMQVAKTENQAYLRKVAVISLGKLHDPKAAGTLIQLLFVELPGVSFYNEARQALVLLGEPAIPELLQTLKRQNADVENLRQTDGSPLAEGAIEAKAASILGTLHAHQAAPFIVEALSKLYKRFSTSKENTVYASVPAGVVEMSYALSLLQPDPKGMALLTRIAADKDERVQQAAKEALASLKG
jgi:HEAT repeat protein